METTTNQQFDESLDRLQAALASPSIEAVDPRQICDALSGHASDIERILGVLRAIAIFVPQAGKLAGVLESLWKVTQRLCASS